MAQPRKPHTRTTTQRGYGSSYVRERNRWKPLVAAGFTHCWRCGRWLDPAQPWHLGHDDHDRRIIHGPECVPCNLGAAARKTNAIRRARSATRKAGTPSLPTPPVRSRRW